MHGRLSGRRRARRPHGPCGCRARRRSRLQPARRRRTPRAGNASGHPRPHPRVVCDAPRGSAQSNLPKRRPSSPPRTAAAPSSLSVKWEGRGCGPPGWDTHRAAEHCICGSGQVPAPVGLVAGHLPPLGAVASVGGNWDRIRGLAAGCRDRGLRRRKQRAWIATVGLLGASNHGTVWSSGGAGAGNGVGRGGGRYC